MMFRSLAAAVLVMSACVHSFTAPGPVPKRGGALSMKKSDLHQDGKKTAASFLTAAYFFANAMSVAPALAVDFVDFGGSTEIIAGRSGGRAGGRSSSYRAPPSRSYSAPPSRSSTTINRSTTIVQPTRTIVQPAMVASPMYMAPPVYNSGPDLGLVLGLSAVNSIGNGMRENRQENEIMRSRSELEMAKQKNFELEQRLRQVEMRQAMAP